MVSLGLDTYTIWAFQSEKDADNHNWYFKDVFKDYDTACDFLEELRILHEEYIFTTDFESLV